MPDRQELNAPVLSVEQKVGTQTTQVDSIIKKIVGASVSHHIGLPATADKSVPSEVTSEKGAGQAGKASLAWKACSLKDAKGGVPVPVLEAL